MNNVDSCLEARLDKVLNAGCNECIAWARLKMERGLPTAGDTYCLKCGAREANVSRKVKRESKGAK